MTSAFLRCPRPLASVLLAALTACVSGPTLAEKQEEIPPLAADHGRIYCYRAPRYSGAAIQSAVFLNDEKIGHAVPGGVFFVDTLPGKYTASSSGGAVIFDLKAGESRFIELYATANTGERYRIRPILVLPKFGSKAVLTHVLLNEDPRIVVKKD